MKVGFIGTGNMAKAMIGGIIKKGVVKAEDIYVTDKATESAKKVGADQGVHVLDTNAEVAQTADILVMAVKPQVYEIVINDIAQYIRDTTVLISIAPGKALDWLTEKFQRELKIVRCMPNTPALVGEGCTGVCPNAHVTDEEMKKVMEILESFGKAYIVPEKLMDTVVGISGSSPAYVFMFIEAMADAAVMDGMPRAQAYEFAAQAVYGSAKMVLETGKHPGELKDMVCSPAGTTIEAVRVLEQKGFRSAVIEAQKACVDKSKSL